MNSHGGKTQVSANRLLTREVEWCKLNLIRTCQPSRKRHSHHLDINSKNTGFQKGKIFSKSVSPSTTCFTSTKKIQSAKIYQVVKTHFQQSAGEDRLALRALLTFITYTRFPCPVVVIDSQRPEIVDRPITVDLQDSVRGDSSKGLPSGMALSDDK